MAKKSFMEKYREFLEKTYERSCVYRFLVHFSRMMRMILYVLLGISIIIVVLFGKPMTSLEGLIYWLTKTVLGKIVAVLFALALIIYGIEKPRK